MMENPALYATSNQLQRRDASIALAAHVPAMRWTEDERVLDIGCGSGDVTASLLLPALPVKCSMVGVDVSESMVQYANDKYSMEGVDVNPSMVQYANDKYKDQSIHFFPMDIEKVEYPRVTFPRGFTKVFSLYCLHWVTDLDKAVSNMRDLLVPGGEGLLVFLASNPLFRAYRMVANKPIWAKYIKDVESFIPVYQDATDPAGHFAGLVTNTGLDVISCAATEFSFTFPNINQLIKALKAVNPFLGRIPVEDQKQFMADCLEALVAIDTPFVGGKAEARYTLMVAHIKK